MLHTKFCEFLNTSVPVKLLKYTCAEGVAARGRLPSVTVDPATEAWMSEGDAGAWGWWKGQVLFVTSCAEGDAARNRLPSVTVDQATEAWMAEGDAGAWGWWRGQVLFVTSCAEGDAARNRLPSVTVDQATGAWMAEGDAGAWGWWKGHVLLMAVEVDSWNVGVASRPPAVQAAVATLTYKNCITVSTATSICEWKKEHDKQRRCTHLHKQTAVP